LEAYVDEVDQTAAEMIRLHGREAISTALLQAIQTRAVDQAAANLWLDLALRMLDLETARAKRLDEMMRQARAQHGHAATR
jgi:hypothetical protein